MNLFVKFRFLNFNLCRKLIFRGYVVEKGLEKGLVEGLEKGLVEGRQEGLVQNAREAILDVLETRFGQVPDSLRERVNTIGSEPTLKNLLRRAVRTPGLEEFQATL